MSTMSPDLNDPLTSLTRREKIFLVFDSPLCTIINDKRTDDWLEGNQRCLEGFVAGRKEWQNPRW